MNYEGKQFKQSQCGWPMCTCRETLDVIVEGLMKYNRMNLVFQLMRFTKGKIAFIQLCYRSFQ